MTMRFTLEPANLLESDFREPYQYCDSCDVTMHEGEDAVKVTMDDNVAIYCIACADSRPNG